MRFLGVYFFALFIGFYALASDFSGEGHGENCATYVSEVAPSYARLVINSASEVLRDTPGGKRLSKMFLGKKFVPSDAQFLAVEISKQNRQRFGRKITTNLINYIYLSTLARVFDKSVGLLSENNPLLGPEFIKIYRDSALVPDDVSDFPGANLDFEPLEVFSEDSRNTQLLKKVVSKTQNFFRLEKKEDGRLIRRYVPTLHQTEIRPEDRYESAQVDAVLEINVRQMSTVMARKKIARVKEKAVEAGFMLSEEGGLPVILNGISKIQVSGIPLERIPDLFDLHEYIERIEFVVDRKKLSGRQIERLLEN
ncbi:MAG: hypothetical protein AB7F43_00375 [Bacteriovoracia bacterium]